MPDNDRKDEDTTCTGTCTLFHERQRLALCGVHAVNNLLQRNCYQKRDFDSLCWELEPSLLFNPHRSLLGIGNYDVNVVVILLQRQGYTVTWHDRRRPITLDEFEQAPHSSCLVGILQNVKGRGLWSKLIHSRHWIALLYNQENGQWLNLDSCLDAPVRIGSHKECLPFLTANGDDSHLLWITKTTDNDGKG